MITTVRLSSRLWPTLSVATRCVSNSCQKFREKSAASKVDVTSPGENKDKAPTGSGLKRSVKSVLHSGQVDEEVRIQGWVKAFRKLKEHVFFDVSDGSSVHRVSVVAAAAGTPKELNMHTSVDVTGVLQRSPKNSALLELHPTGPVKVVGACDQQKYPLGGKIRYTADHIRQYIHLRPKTNQFSSMLRLRSEITRAIHDYFSQNGFFHIHVPLFTSNDCEGAGETFTVKPSSKDLIRDMTKDQDLNSNVARKVEDELVFFDKQVHLSVSGQLHLESAAGGLEKVWTFSPVFRAENTQSSRHLSEFYMVEAELGFCYEIRQILEVMEGLVKFCARRVLTDCVGDWNLQIKENAADVQKILDQIVTRPFTVITFDEACKLLKEKESSIVPSGKGLSREQELLLVGLNDNNPIFVIDWPKEIKPFYMRECLQDQSKVSAVDLLVPNVGELCGGSLREADVAQLTSKINAMDPSGKLLESLSWYLDLRRFGGASTGGFGLGFDRLMLLFSGIGNIKDVSPFPRWPHHCPM